MKQNIVMSKRCLLHALRNTDSLITTVVLPIMLMLLFVFVFGGAIDTGEVEYINYVVPGILLLSIGYCAASTAVSVNTDMNTGIIDRFKAMAISSASALTGHVVASVVRNVLAVLLVLGVALLIGFRPSAGVLQWLGVAGMLLLYTLAMSWISVLFGLIAKTPEGASGFTFFVLFLPYLSSAFVPTGGMPAVLRVFSENQPLTPIIETIRALLLSGQAGGRPIAAVCWCIGIIVVSLAASQVLFRRRSSR